MHAMKKAPHVNKQTHPLSIVKRDGSIVLFDKNKIIVAVKKAMQASGEFKDGSSEKIASPISRKLFMQKKSNPLFITTVEGVQDMVESELMLQGFPETVYRYMKFMKENLGEKLSEDEYAELREAILRQEVMPSMRLMQFAGDPARRCNTCAYNCSFIAPSKIEDFAEIMYLSMQGCGVGFSVESQNIEQLPQIKKQ